MLLLMEFRLPLLHPFSFDKVDARKEEGAGVFKKSPSFSPIAFSPSSAPHLPSSKASSSHEWGGIADKKVGGGLALHQVASS